eukprot:13580472-Ditylum_brightwellii.AAC.1
MNGLGGTGVGPGFTRGGKSTPTVCQYVALETTSAKCPWFPPPRLVLTYAALLWQKQVWEVLGCGTNGVIAKVLSTSVKIKN